ncbi:LolA family protein [Novosphingopyxis baekryungensis]|uniref:LolA family protein n=1 Tax=Novosphingopyxis baekryungensis TaxID=279369 RepID=UPI0003B626DE|nr:outer membrane lipoprotein carrier protein LolA [Novosphingopyxis baekryungensis]
MVRKMIAFAAAAAMAPMAVSLAPAAVAAPASSPDLQKVGAHLKAANTMTADFTQSDRAGQTLTGKLTLKRPGRIRFQYQKGVPLLIVADGKALTMIDYEVNQVQRWPIANSPLSALLDPDNNLAKFGKVIDTGNGNVVRVDVKDPKHPEYGLLSMIFVRNAAAPGGLKLDSWVALDSQNNRTTVRLRNQKFNAPVSDNSFRWNDPRKKSRR